MNFISNEESQRGTFTVWALGLCLILFLLAGISVDVWRAFEARRSLNEIADTAARAGASEIDVREKQLYGRIVLEENSASQAVSDSIDENSELQSVIVDSAISNVDATNNEVSVEVRSTFSFFLLGILPGASDAELVARASARPFEG